MVVFNRSFRCSFCYILRGIFNNLVTGSNTFFISSWKFCLPSLSCNLKTFTWFYNETSSFKFSRSSLSLIGNNIKRFKKLQFRKYLLYMWFCFHWKYDIYHQFFSHINTKIVESFTPSFMTHFFKFIIFHIISSDIVIHTLDIS